MRRKIRLQISFFIAVFLFITNINLSAQELIYPGCIKKPLDFGVSGPLINNPVVSYLDIPAKEYPQIYGNNALIKPPNFTEVFGAQTNVGTIGSTLLKNFAGQSTNAYPPDANGDVSDE